MPKYIDGFVLPVPKKNLDDYRRMAKMASKVFREHGALEYREAIGEDLNMAFGLPFPKLTKVKAGETVIFAWIVYKSRAHRDRVSAKVMADPRMNQMMQGKKMPFDVKRMAVGGFEIFVDA